MTEYGRIHTDGSRSGGQPVGSDAEAMRYGFDGFGYKYIDSGSGSDWRTRHPDAEPLYLGQPTHSNIFDASDVQKHTLIVEQEYASHTVKVKSLDDSQPTQSDCEVAASIRSALYRACSNMPNYPKGIVEPFVAAHHRHGYDQGYYDGRKMDAMEERAAIVAYARGHGGNAWSRDVLYFAEKIEAGEHLK